MKRLVPAFFLMLFAAQNIFAQTPTKNDADRRIDILLSKMTLEEKVGQMTQVTLDVICEGEPYNLKSPLAISMPKLKKAVIDYKVGSILNTGISANTQQRWHEIINAIQDAAKDTKLKIPVLYGIDAIHGTNYTQGTTLFPQQIGLAATWNPQLTEELGAIAAYETRASAIPWTFSPVLDLGRNPLWPRIWEGFGEDVFLSSELGKALTRGYQGKNMADKFRVAACLKHFTCYGAPLSGKDRTPAWVPERYLHEYYIPGFAAAINEGAASIMINSGERNGIPSHADKHLLTEILRNQLNFKGVAVSDWEDIILLHTRHHVATTPKEAVKIAVMAGIDMSMVPTDFSFSDYLVQLVKDGEVPMTRIDEATRRILKMKMDLGLFEKTHYPMSDYPKFASEEFRLKSLQGAQECLVLLKNQKNILPLAKNAKILVTGPSANTMRSLNGGWTYSWQGNIADELAKDKNTILEAVQAKIGAANVTYVEGSTFKEPINIEAAAEAAKNVDAVVLCLGETSYTEHEGSFDNILLEDAQIDLANAVAKAGKPVILILAEGRPRVFNKIEPKMNAIVYVPLPGNEGGNALADVIFGDINPSGKMPITYPKHPNSLINYDHKYTENVKGMANIFDPQFEFGTGLSYTNFGYKNLALSKSLISNSDELTISVDVTNTGSRAGKEVVQLYVSDLYASITPPVRRLRGFEKIDLKAGQTRSVTFKIKAKDLAFVGLDNKFINEAGDFRVNIGGLTAMFALK